MEGENGKLEIRLHLSDMAGGSTAEGLTRGARGQLAGGSSSSSTSLAPAEQREVADAGARQVDSGHLRWSLDHRSDCEDEELLPGPPPSAREC